MGLNTTNMNLTKPTVSVDSGPGYATTYNSNMDLLDAHDHTTGKGVKLPSGALNIQSDLSLNGYGITTASDFTLQAQGSTTSAKTGRLFAYGVDLYYTDINGNVIRVTQSGGLAGTPGSIASLASPASATWVPGTSSFVWQSGVNIAANLDCRNVILRNNSASSYGLTLSPPSGLAANRTVTLPNIVSSNAMMLSIDANGQMYARVNESVGQQESAVLNFSLDSTSGKTTVTSSISFTIASVTNSLITITTTGRPVIVKLMPAGGASLRGPYGPASSVYALSNGSYTQSAFFLTMERNGSTTFEQGVVPSSVGTASVYGSVIIPPSSFEWFDSPPAGTHSYGLSAVVQALLGKYAYGAISNAKLIVYEL